MNKNIEHKEWFIFNNKVAYRKVFVPGEPPPGLVVPWQPPPSRLDRHYRTIMTYAMFVEIALLIIIVLQGF